MIYVRTFAYNAAKTLPRTIESVLNQTYKDFYYYLCDNGSTDNGKTRRIVEDYASQDDRIVPFYNEKNHVWDGNEKLIYLMRYIEDDDYYCVLDADDEYKPDFLEKMVAFLEENNLDIAACGSDFINVENNQICGIRNLKQDLILEGEAFETYFPRYYQFMRTGWGKLSKGKIWRNVLIDRDDPSHPIVYGGDTFWCMQGFGNARRAGIMAQSLHKYYISKGSTSYVFHPERINDDRKLHNQSIKFLLEKTGNVNAENCKFLYLIYFNAIKDTLTVALNSKIPTIEKMQSIHEVFTCEYTQELLHHNYVNINSELDELRDAVLKWLLAQKECRREEGAGLAAEILVSMYIDLEPMVSKDGLKYIISKIPEIVEHLLKKDYQKILERLRTWFKRHDVDVPVLTELEISAYHALSKSDEEIFTLLINTRKNRPRASKELGIDAQICKLIEKYPLLKSMGADLASTFPYAIRWTIKGDYKQALNAFISVQDVEINDEDAEAYILFGQNLSAAAENTDAYIYFKKIWISYLIDCSRTEEAVKELDEFEQILPHDDELMGLRKRLNNNI